MAEYLSERLGLGITPLPPMKKYMKSWIELRNRTYNLKNEVTVAIVGKYTRLEDSYTSITKALSHAGNKLGYKVNINFIEASNLETSMRMDDPASYHTAWHNLCICE